MGNLFKTLQDGIKLVRSGMFICPCPQISILED